MLELRKVTFNLQSAEVISVRMFALPVTFELMVDANDMKTKLLVTDIYDTWGLYVIS